MLAAGESEVVDGAVADVPNFVVASLYCQSAKYRQSWPAAVFGVDCGEYKEEDEHHVLVIKDHWWLLMYSRKLPMKAS
jgi:hypothetical protein